MVPKEINARSLLDIVSRRRWAIILPFVGFVMLAGWLAVVLPKSYKAEATLLVQPRAVPSTYVQPLSTLRSEDWLRSLAQRVTSRERMLALADSFGLFKGRTDSQRADLMKQSTSVDLIDLDLRKESVYKLQNQQQQPDVTAFKLSFESSDPTVSAAVANRLASQVVAENAQTRSSQASTASAFIEQELAASQKRLDAQHARLEAFKRLHSGELPEQQQANITNLTNAQMQLQSLSQTRLLAEEKIPAIRRQITELVHGLTPVDMAKGGPTDVDPLLTQLQAKRAEVQLLRSKYTPRHPDVVKAQTELARFEKQLESAGSSGVSPDMMRAASRNPIVKDLKAQLTTAQAEASRLRAEEAGLRQQIALYQRRIETGPARAQELEALERDYAGMKTAYQAMTDKRLEARMAANLESERAGDQFKILDKAAVPEKPYKPSMRKLFVFCLIMGASLGVILSLVLEFADDSFREVRDTEGFLGLPVLASVPQLQTAVERAAAARARKRIALTATSLAAVYVVLLVFLHANGISLKLPV